MNEISQGRIFDPTTLAPIRLSPGAVQQLAPELSPSKASPLTPLLELKAEKTFAELDTLGIPHAKRSGSTSPSAKGKAYRQALETLARPELTLTLAEISASGPPISFRLLLGNERAVLADIDELGLSFSPPMAYPELVKALARHFENTPAFAEQKAFWPSQLKILSTLFSSDAGPIEADANATQLKARFEKSQVSEGDAKEVLAEMEKTGLVTAKGGGAYALSENSAFWLTRMSSGQVGELTYVVHDEKGNSIPAASQLRFVGPPKDRVTMVTVTGEDLKGLAGDDAHEAVGVVCQVMDRPTLTGFLEAFLGVAQAS